MHGNHRWNERNINRKALRWATLRVPSIPSLVQKAMLLLENLQTWISSVPFHPLRNFTYTTRNTENIPLFKTKPNFFENSFFFSAAIKWNGLDYNIRNVGIFRTFKNNILKFIRPTPNSAFNCENLRGIKPIKRLHVGFSHLRECKFKGSFQGKKSNLQLHLMLNRLPITFATAPCTMMKGIPSWPL